METNGMKWVDASYKLAKKKLNSQGVAQLAKISTENTLNPLLL